MAEHEDIIDRIQQRLTELGRERHVDLLVDKEGSRFEDEWLYVSVEPGTGNIRVSDYAELLSEVEKGLREEGVNNVLLVPARAA